MEIVFHLGGHCTDDGLLIRSILQNRAKLAENGIIVPGPARYRDLIGECSTKLRGDPADAKTEAIIIEAISEDPTAERVILSNENFLCRPNFAFGPSGLYPKAEKSAWLRQCVPSHQVEFSLAIRNPASFLPDVISRADSIEMLADVPLGDLLWSNVVANICEHNPGIPITIWCHEDTPFIWPEIVRNLTDHDAFEKMDGAYDMLDTIITDEGMSRLMEFLAKREVTNETKRRRAISAFLEVHGVEEAIQEEVTLPGWTDGTIDVLSEIYEEDVDRIASMSGVTFIAA